MTVEPKTLNDYRMLLQRLQDEGVLSLDRPLRESIPSIAALIEAQRLAPSNLVDRNSPPSLSTTARRSSASSDDDSSSSDDDSARAFRITKWWICVSDEPPYILTGGEWDW